ncbi:hypothetical protein Trydic_g13357 [Trypoxylus dichotomus]
MPKVKRKIKQTSFDGEDNDTGTESEEYHSDSTQSAKYHKLSPNNSILSAINDLQQGIEEHGHRIDKLQEHSGCNPSHAVIPKSLEDK